MDWTAHFDIYEYLEDEIGVSRTAHGGKGEEYICDCPFCGKRLKLYVNAERGIYICYSCEETGALPHLVMELEDVSYREAVNKITKSAGARLSSSLEAVRAKRTKRAARRARHAAPVRPNPGTSALPPEYRPVWDPKTGRRLRVSYLEEDRGFTYGTCRRLRLGICTEGDYRGRVVFPVIEHGQVVTFQARATGDVEPKYMNPGGIDKGDFIYGHDLVLGHEAPIVVEGPTDVVSCFQKGFMACAPLGKTITRRQIKKLRSIGAKKLRLLLDGEAINDAIKAASMAIEVMDVEIARLPYKMDPDDAPKELIAAVLADARPPTTRELRTARSL